MGEVVEAMPSLRHEFTRVHLMEMWKASEETGDAEAIQKLLAKGFPVNTDLDGEGTAGDYTALHAASRSGFDNCVDLLLDSNANVHALANGDRSPLHLAASNGHEGCVRRLLDANADVRRSDKDGKTALDLADESYPESALVELLEEAEKEAMKKPKSPVLGPRKKAQEEAEAAALARLEASRVPSHMPGASHLPWKPRNHTQMNLYNIGNHGEECAHRGSINRGDGCGAYNRIKFGRKAYNSPQKKEAYLPEHDFIAPDPVPTSGLKGVCHEEGWDTHTRSKAWEHTKADNMIAREDWLYWDDI